MKHLMERAVVHLITTVFILAAAFVMASAILFWMPAEAQAERQLPTQTEVEPCVLVNTYGTLEIVRCEDPDTWQVYYVNSLGFMLVIE